MIKKVVKIQIKVFQGKLAGNVYEKPSMQFSFGTNPRDYLVWRTLKRSTVFAFIRSAVEQQQHFERSTKANRLYEMMRRERIDPRM